MLLQIISSHVLYVLITSDVGDTSCLYGNTICDQLCVQNDTSFYCACMDGMRYDVTQGQCVSSKYLEYRDIIREPGKFSVYTQLTTRVYVAGKEYLIDVADPILDENFLLVADDYRHVIYQLHPQNVTHLSAIKVITTPLVNTLKSWSVRR